MMLLVVSTSEEFILVNRSGFLLVSQQRTYAVAAT
jgi:hypothetical protein